VREDRVVPNKDEDALVLDSIRALVTKFPHTPAEKTQLRGIRMGSYVGMIKGGRTGRPTLFTIWNQDRTNKVRWITRKDPTFADRVIEIYRAEEVDWGSSFMESDSGKKDMPTWQPAKTAGVVEARR
jgi:hypothetical protein